MEHKPRVIGEGREDTILDLSKEIKSLLDDFQVRLDCHFSRSELRDTGMDRPEQPNVLDEVIERLRENSKHLDDIMTFISSKVLPKIN